MHGGIRCRFAILIVLLCGVTTLTSVPALAQLPTGSIQGTITDPSGAVVPNATVTITNKATGQEVVLTTSARGAYSSGPLLPSTYTVRVQAKGFHTLEAPVLVQVGEAASGNFRLKIGEESQVVNVEASTIRVNTEQPTVQGVLTANQIENLPLGGRNFLNLAQLEPGVQIQDGGNFDPTKNGFSSISFGGRYGRTARITLDGIDVSDETVGTTTQNISAGAIQEFQVSQSTLDVSTDLTSSGAVNVVTKSGTNSLHGQGFYLFRDKRAGLANFPGGQDSYFQRNEFGGSLGGPIWKNKLFFFLNGEHIRQPLQVPLTPPPPFQSIPQGYPAAFKETDSLGRLDWQIKPGMHMFYRFTYDFNADVRAFGGTYQPFANRDNTPAQGVGLDFNTGSFTHSIRFGYLKFQNHIADAVLGNAGVFNPADGIANIAIRIGGADTVTRFGPSRLAPQATFQTDHEIKYDGTKVVGSHILRYGIAYNHILGGGYAAFYGIAGEARASNSLAAQAFADAGPFPGGRANPLNYAITTIVLGNGQGFFTETPQFGYPAGGQFDNRLGIYFGDSYKIKPNLTLTMGLRWDRDTGRQDSDLPSLTCDQINAANFGGMVPCTGNQLILDQFGAGLGKQVRQPNTNFGPQVGFAWDPWKSGKTVIRGGAGVFYENAVFNNILFDRPGRLPTGLFFGEALPCSSGSLDLPTGAVSSVNGVDIASGICGQRIGSVAPLVAQMETMLQAATKAAGAAANGNFLGNTLANGPNSTGNGFIAPSYRTPRSIQMNLGLQRQLGSGMVLSADFIRNVGEHYLLSYDTNHVGDARYLNKVAALHAISAANSKFGCGTGTDAVAINCAIQAGATIQDYAGMGLDSGDYYLGGLPASANGLTPDTGAAFPGINPLVGENNMLFSIGRSTYTGVQVKLVGNRANPLPYVSQGSFIVSWAGSRFNTMAADQDFVPFATDYANPTGYYGPGSLDRTFQLSFGGSFQISHGPLLSFVSHFYSPLSQTLTLEALGRPGEIFKTDLTGDGTPVSTTATGDVITGQQLGSFGRGVNASNINEVINKFNQTVAGTLTPAGQALVNAGLFSQSQLVSLGAVVDPLPLAPKNEVNLGWFRAFDFRFTWPVKVGERFTLEPSVGVYNLFNFANFDPAGNTLSGILNGAPGSVNGTTYNFVQGDPNNPGGRDSTRIGLGTGSNTAGSARQMEWGLKVTF
jgi:hypothetical protein